MLIRNFEKIRNIVVINTGKGKLSPHLETDSL